MKNLVLAILCGIVGVFFAIVEVFSILTIGEPNAFLLISGLAWIISSLAWMGFGIYFEIYYTNFKKERRGDLK